MTAVIGCGEDFPSDDDDDAQSQVATAALVVGNDPGRVTRADGGFKCPPAPCPSNAPWDYDVCACVARKPARDGGVCLPEVCPPGTRFSFDSCSCAASGKPDAVNKDDISVTRANEPRVTPDAGTCDPVPCPPMAPFDPVTCSCQGVVAEDPSDETDDGVREVDPAPQVGCGMEHSHTTRRPRRIFF